MPNKCSLNTLRGTPFHLTDVHIGSPNIQTRDLVQSNFGRLQQRGKESYRRAFDVLDFDSEKTVYSSVRRGVANQTPMSSSPYVSDVTIRDMLSYFLKSAFHTQLSKRRSTLWSAWSTTQAHNAHASYFLQLAKDLDRIKQTDVALDLIYDRIDSLLRKSAFDVLDLLLRTVDTADYSADILLGLLTATLPAKTKLPSRKLLFLQVEDTLKRRGDWEDGLLSGLES